jgi:hypothetical protein
MENGAYVMVLFDRDHLPAALTNLVQCSDGRVYRFCVLLVRRTLIADCAFGPLFCRLYGSISREMLVVK